MSFIKDLEDLVIDVLENSKHPAINAAYDELCRDKFTNKDFDLVFGDIVDLVEEIDLDPGKRRDEERICNIVAMVVAKWVIDEDFTDSLSDREFRKVEDAADHYEELIERLEDRDGDRRNGRSNRRRRRSSRQGDDYAASDRNGRSGRRRNEDEGRNRRRSSRGDEYRESFRNRRRSSNENEPKTLVQRRAEMNRAEANEEVEAPQTSQAIARANRNERNNGRAYDFVGETNVAPVVQGSKTEQELGFLYSEVPVGTMDDYRELGINVDDPAFIITRPVDGADSFREVIYDPFEKQPKWELNAEGLRVLRFRDFNMNIDNHVIPDFRRSASVPSRTINRAILPSLTHPSRRSILDISKKADERDRQHEDALTEWEANNKDLPEEERDTKPVSPAIEKLGTHTLRVDSAIDTSSLGDMIQETMSRFGQVRGFAEGHPPVESYGSLRQYAWCASSVEERDDIMKLVEMFSVNHHHTSDDGKNVVPINKYHSALMATVDTIPFGLWKRINRRMTEYCNDIFSISLGINVEITDFSEDGDKIIPHLNEKFGQHIVEAFIIAHAQVGNRISMLEAGRGDNDLLIYEVKGTQVTILPVTPEELTISSVKIDNGKQHAAPALVTGESNLRLFNALRSITTQSTPIMGKQTPFKYLAFSDGTVYRIDRNAMGLSGANKRESVEFLLTQISYC